MLEDVGIAEWQKVKTQGRGDHIKQLSIQPPTGIFMHTCIMKKICRGVVYLILNTIYVLVL